jgi:septal ring factor EnvC (AmiA/AmiB activator)
LQSDQDSGIRVLQSEDHGDFRIYKLHILDGLLNANESLSEIRATLESKHKEVARFREYMSELQYELLAIQDDIKKYEEAVAEMGFKK